MENEEQGLRVDRTGLTKGQIRLLDWLNNESKKKYKLPFFVIEKMNYNRVVNSSLIDESSDEEENKP